MQAIIQELLEHEGGMCVSLIMPTHYKAFGERARVASTLNKSLHTVEKGLLDRCDQRVCKRLSAKVRNLAKTLDLDHPPAGVGLFVSEGLARLVEFPFPVKEKVILSDTFEIQDILYNLDKLVGYHVLLLSKHHTRLFKGVGSQLREVRGGDFPMRFEDPYEEDERNYHALHSKDPSKVLDKRVEAFLREVYHKSRSYVKESHLVLMGGEKHMSRYKGMGRQLSLLGEVVGIYDQLRPHEVAGLVCPVVEKYQRALEEKLLEVIKMKVGQGKALHGVEALLPKLEELYKGHLIVERDFEIQGYVDPENGNLVVRPFDPLRYKKVPNVVEHLIERVIKLKHCRVDMVGHNLLQGYGRVVFMS